MNAVFSVHFVVLYWAGSLRLSFPSTHTRFRSPLSRGLPCPVGSAFRVFVYPLSGLLLQNPLSHFSDPSVLGIFSFRVFLPSKSRTSLEALALLPFSPQPATADFFGRAARLQSVGLQSFSPFEEPCSPGPLLHDLREPVLSWSSRLWGFPLRPFLARQSHSSFALSVATRSSNLAL